MDFIMLLDKGNGIFVIFCKALGNEGKSSKNADLSLLFRISTGFDILMAFLQMCRRMLQQTITLLCMRLISYVKWLDWCQILLKGMVSK